MKYWLRYSKLGLTRYTGHLDILHQWERILRRAKLPLAFSQGFSPHPLLSLAAPLPVGQLSYAEYLEFELVRPMSPEAILSAVNQALPAEMRALAVSAVPSQTKPLMSLIQFTDYQLLSPQVDDLSGRVGRFLDSPSCTLVVKRKGGPKPVDIRPLVRSLAVENEHTLSACLSTGSNGNLRPEDLWRALGSDAPVTITRLELYLPAEDRLVTPWQSLGILD